MTAKTLALPTIKVATQSASHWSTGNPQMPDMQLMLMIARQTIAYLAPLPLVKRAKMQTKPHQRLTRLMNTPNQAS